MSVNVEPILDRKVFEVAQPSIDSAQHLVRSRIGREAGLTTKAGLLCRLDDQLGEALAAAAVDAIGLSILVNQPFEPQGISGQSGRDQRRRQMPDRDGGNPTLSLRCLTRVADDKWIENWQCADDGFRKASSGQRHGLTG